MPIEFQTCRSKADWGHLGNMPGLSVGGNFRLSCATMASMIKQSHSDVRRTACAVGLASALGLSLMAGQTAHADAGASVGPRAEQAVLVPGTQSVQFIFRLHKSAESKAASRLKAVSTPGNSKFRKFKSAAKIATMFGAPASTEAALATGLAGTGLTAAVDASRLFARVTGTAASWQTAISQPLVSLTDIDQPGIAIVGPRSMIENINPVLPGDLASITEPIWQSNTYAPPAVRDLPVARDLPVGGNKAPFKDACRAAKKAAANWNFNVGASLSTKGSAFSPKEVANAYGINKLQGSASNGKKAKVGIISLGSGFNNKSAEVAAKCFGWKNAKNKAIATDGMAGPMLSAAKYPSEIEGDLDIQTIRAMVPNSGTLRVYQALAEQNSFLPYVKALNSKHRPDVLSTSYGSCETSYVGDTGGTATRDLMNAAFIRLGLTGTSVLISSGDQGSSACSAEDPTDKAASVSFPASSPWVTAVGGTQLRLTKNATRKTEVVWNQPYLFTANAGLRVGGGGGLSTMFDRPFYQNPSQTNVTTEKRAVPDIAAHAAIGPSIPFYTSGAWAPGNGTSQATPLIAGAIALLSARERAAGRPPLGFINPWLYKTGKKRKSAFFDVRAGTNEIYLQGGGYAARKGYDLASGLGVPNFAALMKYSKK